MEEGKGTRKMHRIVDYFPSVNGKAIGDQAMANKKGPTLVILMLANSQPWPEDSGNAK